jgi:hypothetical protein
VLPSHLCSVQGYLDFLALVFMMESLPGESLRLFSGYRMDLAHNSAQLICIELKMTEIREGRSREGGRKRTGLILMSQFYSPHTIPRDSYRPGEEESQKSGP